MMVTAQKENKMNELSLTIIHGLLATFLALAPLALAAYYDVKSRRSA
jgi:hypothetical protein